MKSGTGHETLERLSMLMDGEADEACLRAGCAAWREDAAGRAAWHAYHLIGDVLRSEELADGACRDAAFLASVRLRLEQEPALLAPSDVQSPAVAAPRASRWRASAAVAAGFVVVGGAVLVLRAPPTELPPATFAQAAAPARPLAPAATLAAAAAPAELPPSGQMLRDARLQQYLVAHKQFGGSTALGVPSGFLRSATVDVPAR